MPRHLQMDVRSTVDRLVECLKTGDQRIANL